MKKQSQTAAISGDILMFHVPQVWQEGVVPERLQFQPLRAAGLDCAVQGALFPFPEQRLNPQEAFLGF